MPEACPKAQETADIKHEIGTQAVILACAKPTIEELTAEGKLDAAEQERQEAGAAAYKGSGRGPA